LTTVKDNTGSKHFVEGMIFPTLDFPSDHGITSTILVEEGVASSGSGSGRKTTAVNNNSITNKEDRRLRRGVAAQ
jgi:hypothetical protein